jgi:glycyl-tRNA synthetase beta chain
MPDFLLEIGCEEIPASYIAPACEAFKDSLKKALGAEGLAFETVVSTATPRRLIFFGKGLPAETKEREEIKSGPPIDRVIGPDSGPTSTALGFAKSQGVPVTSIEFPLKSGKTTNYYTFEVLVRMDAEFQEARKTNARATVRRPVPPKSSAAVLAAMLPKLIASIPFPKSMYWKDPAFRFARPLRRILALFGSEVIPFEVNGIKSGRATVGHPFLASKSIDIERADLDLLKARLRDARVIADRDERRSRILEQVESALAAHGSKLAEWDLLEEVTDLVEWPEILEGSFDRAYLGLPEEVVATAMMEHQRYFPVRDASGKLVNRFLTISNRPKEYRDSIREGNERVLAARLNDARFFWESDVKTPLEKVAEGLSSVMYLAGLGTVARKVERMKKLAAWAADAAGLANDKSAAVEAASLSKADLLTEMVFEFPSLQGVMGRAYALAQSKPAEVAYAIEEHYLPRTLSGDLPKTLPGKLAAVSDKADTLAGAFVMGLVPSGSQDPYGLRRASIGVVRIIVEGQIRLNLRKLLKEAWDLASGDAREAPKVSFDDLLAFVRERIYQYYLDRGARHDILRACLASGFDDVADLAARLDALAALSKEESWGSLVTAVERTSNITKGYAGPDDVDGKLATEKEEKVLFDLYASHAAAVDKLIAARDYAAASRRYLEVFGEPLHTFFDKVFVNVDDIKIRNNRLALIRKINRLYSARIADLTHIVQEAR